MPRVSPLAIGLLLAGCARQQAAAPSARLPRAERPPHFEVHVADVGTGLAVFVDGEDFTLVYDAGSADDDALGESNRFVHTLRTIRPSLTRLDHVVLSHPHSDHVALLPDLFNRYAVGEVWDSGVINPVCGYRRFVAAVAHSQATYHSAAHDAGVHVLDFGKEVCRTAPTETLRHGARLREGARVTLGRGATMSFLHVDGVRHGDRYNENSLVVRVELGEVRLLLMGDAEGGERDAPSAPPAPSSVEGALLARHRADLDADVLVVGHHGSKTSSRHAFVAAVTPRVSVISSGPQGYGRERVVLPDPEVVDELRRAGTVLETDLDDDSCGRDPHKLGPDADQRPGGCSHVRIQIDGPRLQAETLHLSD